MRVKILAILILMCSPAIGDNGEFDYGEPVFDDSLFLIYDNGDETKMLALEVSGITTGTTRIWTVPDSDIDFTTIADIAGLTPTDSFFIVGDGSNWVTESGATARTSIGLGTGDNPTFDGITSGNIVPSITETYNLGSPTHKWVNLVFTGYLSDGVKSTTAAQVNTAYTHTGDNTQAHTDYLLNSGNDETSGTLTAAGFTTAGTVQAEHLYSTDDIVADDKITCDTFNLGDAAGGGFVNSCVPSENASFELGNSSYRWSNLFLSGDVTDGTNATSAAEIKAAHTHIGESGASHSLLSATAGTAEASKALIVDNNIDIDTIRNLGFTGELYSADGNIRLGAAALDGYIDGGFQVQPNARGKYGLLMLDSTGGGRRVGFYLSSSGHGIQYLANSSNVNKIQLYAAGDSYLSGGNIGIGDGTPSTILDVVAGSATDPVADAWDTHCGRNDLIPLKEIHSNQLDILKDIKLYQYKRKPLATEVELLDALTADLPEDKSEEKTIADFTESEIEAKKAEISEEKAKLPKFKVERIGMMMDDDNIPDELLVLDKDGNKVGVSLVGYIGYLHAGLKEAALKIETLEQKAAPPVPAGNSGRADVRVLVAAALIGLALLYFNRKKGLKREA